MDVLSAIKTASREEQPNETKVNLAVNSSSSESSFSDFLTQADLTLKGEGPAVTSERLAKDNENHEKENPSPKEYFVKGNELLATPIAKVPAEISSRGKGEQLVKSTKELLSWELGKARASLIDFSLTGNKSGEKAKDLFLENKLQLLDNKLRQTEKSDNPLLKTVNLFFTSKDNFKDSRDSQLLNDKGLGKLATNPLLTAESFWRMGFRPSPQKQKGQQVEKWQEGKSQEPSLMVQVKKANFNTAGRSEKANQIPSGITNPTLDFVSRETTSLGGWLGPVAKGSNEHTSPLMQYKWDKKDNFTTFTTQERLLPWENPKTLNLGKNETFTLNRQFNDIIQNARLQLLENGNATLTARLFPKELGSITVNLTLTDGIVTAKFTVANEMVQRELINYLENIRQQLKEDGIMLSSFTVNVGGQTFSKQQHSLEESPLLSSIAIKAGNSYEKNSLTKTVAWEGLYA